MLVFRDQDISLEAQIAFAKRFGNLSTHPFATNLPDVPEVIEFDNRMEELIAGAKAVVAMGGYNTYCEILSFDKPALIVPRTRPRQEQLIRARRAAELGLVEMLLPDEAADPRRLAAALKALPRRPPPSRTAEVTGMEGLPTISAYVEAWLGGRGLSRTAAAGA